MAQSNYLNRAFLISSGVPTYWLAQDYDLDMSDHPSKPNAALYTGFTICGRVPVVSYATDAAGPRSEPPVWASVPRSDDFLWIGP